jgi:pyruvate formate lyase activating enzyme
MQISWINKFTLIDFPWQISCIVFTPWCNFRCGFCHNSEFVLPEKLKLVYENIISEKAVFNFLELRKWSLTWVSICWWEPTLQNDLIDFCVKVKKMWYLVKLDTNWRDPKKIKELIDKKLVDYVAMDIKNEIWKFSISAWVDLDEKPYLKTIKLLLDSDIDYEFRTTVVKWVHNEKTIENITKYIFWAKQYSLQNFKWWNLLDENFEWESFFPSELEIFKKIAEKNIKKVLIRN